MSVEQMIGAGGGGQDDFQLTKFALSVLEFQGSIRAVLNRDTGEMPRSGEIAALLQGFLEKNSFSVADIVGDSLPLAVARCRAVVTVASWVPAHALQKYPGGETTA